MIVSYYPGCTLKTKAKELDAEARKCAEALGITLEEISEWQCCGACYPASTDEIATRLSAVRALMAAKEKGQEIVSVCSACHNVLKRTNADMRSNDNIKQKVNNYLSPAVPYAGEAKVLHYLEMLRDKVGFEKLREKVTNPLTGRKIAAYYGCLLLRPGKVMAFDNPENPSIIENFIRAIGAEPVIYPYRNECCGGYMILEDAALTKKKSADVLKSAENHGAELICTACPLCLYNLRKNGDKSIPVVYFTKLLAEALNIK